LECGSKLPLCSGAIYCPFLPDGGKPPHSKFGREAFPDFATSTQIEQEFRAGCAIESCLSSDTRRLPCRLM